LDNEIEEKSPFLVHLIFKCGEKDLIGKNFIIDTGSCFSFFSKDLFEKLENNYSILEYENVSLVNHDILKIKFIKVDGKLVGMKDFSSLEFGVSEENILGRDLLNWSGIKISIPSTSILTPSEILSNYNLDDIPALFYVGYSDIGRELSWINIDCLRGDNSISMSSYLDPSSISGSDHLFDNTNICNLNISGSDHLYDNTNISCFKYNLSISGSDHLFDNTNISCFNASFSGINFDFKNSF
jgi:hypothetical protein